MEPESLQEGVGRVFLLVSAAISSLFNFGNTQGNEILVDPQVYSSQIVVQEPQIIHEMNPIFYLEPEEIPESLALEAEVTLKPTTTKKPTPTSSPKPKATAPPFPTLSKSPTPTKSPSPTIPTPTITLSPTPKPIVLVIPSVQPYPVINSLDSDLLFTLINNKRKSLDLSPFEKDEKLCLLAEYRGPQLYEEIFGSGKLHKGLYDLKVPYQIIENMAYYNSEQKILQWWLGSQVHRAAILGNYKYSCGVCAGNACAQLFTNFVPKI